MLLGYKVSKDFCEILMNYNGSNLCQWIAHISDYQTRLDFAADLLRQGIIALKTVHALGYSHGDLKPENVCARQSRNGKLKFTLIDFGIGRKLGMPNDDTPCKHFRGNFLFCSDRQLKMFKPTQFCDLIALVYIAYFVVYKEVPATEYAQELIKKNKFVGKLEDPGEFRAFRLKHKTRLELLM